MLISFTRQPLHNPLPSVILIDVNKLMKPGHTGRDREIIVCISWEHNIRGLYESFHTLLYF